MNANIVMDRAPVEELARLNGTRATLSQKLRYLQQHPLDSIDRRIERTPNSSQQQWGAIMDQATTYALLTANDFISGIKPASVHCAPSAVATEGGIR